MSIAVKCVCGEKVYAEEDQRGQNLECPHCQAVVAVPAGKAAKQPAKPAKPPSAGQEALFVIACVVGLSIFLAVCGGILPPPVTQALTALGSLALFAAVGTWAINAQK